MNRAKDKLVQALRRIRRRVRREVGPYSQISAAQVIIWIDAEIKRRKHV